LARADHLLGDDVPLALHGSYSRDEVLAALDDGIGHLPRRDRVIASRVRLNRRSMRDGHSTQLDLTNISGRLLAQSSAVLVSGAVATDCRPRVVWCP